jgi:hypothetical protein
VSIVSTAAYEAWIVTGIPKFLKLSEALESLQMASQSNQNISSTFDPDNLRCVVCPTSHYILAKGKDESPPR